MWRMRCDRRRECAEYPLIDVLNDSHVRVLRWTVCVGSGQVHTS